MNPPFLIKTNVTHYITGEAFFSCEKFLKKNQIEAGLGIIYPFHPWINFIESKMYWLSDEVLSDTYCSGVSVRVQYKISLLKRHTNSNLYISPLLMFKNKWKNKVWVLYPDGEHNSFGREYESLESDKKNVYALELLLGHETLINNKFVFDIYAGIGYRGYKRYDRYIYDMKPNYYFTPHSICIEKGKSMSLHLGVLIGLKINNKYISTITNNRIEYE